MSATQQKRVSIKSVVLAYVEQHKPAVIDGQQLAALRLRVAKSVGPGRSISQQYLLDVLSQTDVPIARSLGGLPADLRGRVHFRDAEAAACSLLNLQREFEEARRRGDSQRAQDCCSASEGPSAARPAAIESFGGKERRKARAAAVVLSMAGDPRAVRPVVGIAPKR